MGRQFNNFKEIIEKSMKELECFEVDWKVLKEKISYNYHEKERNNNSS